MQLSRLLAHHASCVACQWHSSKTAQQLAHCGVSKYLPIRVSNRILLILFICVLTTHGKQLEYV